MIVSNFLIFIIYKGDDLIATEPRLSDNKVLRSIGGKISDSSALDSLEIADCNLEFDILYLFNYLHLYYRLPFV